MTQVSVGLPVNPQRANLMRIDSAGALKRYFYLERALTLTCAGWIPDVSRLESKATMARSAWQSAMTADALRNRVFELRYPDKTLDPGADVPLIRLFEASLHAPSGAAAMRSIAEVFAPALRAVYEKYLEASDIIADGPTARFLELAIKEKQLQEQELAAVAREEFDARRVLQGSADDWVRALSELLEQFGGVGLHAPAVVEVPEVVVSGKRFALRTKPARDDRYFVTDFYWPDNFDANVPYGTGLQLQLRSAISHLNEVWAVETAAAILQGLSPELGWEFTVDASRWVYDESRHMLMGKQRLDWWGIEPSSTPLGSYIYGACSDQDPIYQLGMLGYYETKNIGKKRDRAAEFREIGDGTSQRDMDFDWADEAIHAGYGRRWLRYLLVQRGKPAEDWPKILKKCEELVSERVATASEEEKSAVRECAADVVNMAERLASHRS